MNGLALCAGAGGLELGVQLARPDYRTVAYVERAPAAVAVLRARIADGCLHDAPIWDDVTTFDGRPWRGRVHCLTAGYPCQPFSSAGQRRGAADPRHLWPHVARIIAEVEPDEVFIENVVGHLSLGFDRVVAELQGMGRRVAAGVFSAREGGAGHLRRRVFGLAHAAGLPAWRLSGPGAGGRAPGVPERARRVAGGQPGRRGAGVVGAVAADAGVRGGRRGQTGAPGGFLLAPEPGDLVAWARLLGAAPGLEPTLPGEADGLAGRVDRQHLAGNGVCSLAAALAYRTLSAALDQGLAA